MAEMETPPVSKTGGANYKAGEHTDYRTVASNIDWFGVSVREEEIPEDRYAELHRKWDEAGTKGRAIELEGDCYVFMGEPLTLQREHNMTLVLKNDYLYARILLPESKRPDSFALYSPAFWQNDRPEEALEVLQAWLNNFYGHEVKAFMQRLDLCKDVAGFSTSEYFNHMTNPQIAAHFRSRAGVEPKAPRGQVTGVVVGSRGGDVYMRMYDKIAELEKSRKAYYQPTWARNGWQEGEAVTRIEYEFHTAFFRQWRGPNGETAIGMWECFDQIVNMWDYASRWCAMVVPDANQTNVSRLQLHLLWEVVAESFVPGCAPGRGTRFSRRSQDARALDAQIVGCIRSRLALTAQGEEYSISDIHNSIIAPAMGYAIEKYGRHWYDMVRDRRAEIVAAAA